VIEIVRLRELSILILLKFLENFIRSINLKNLRSFDGKKSMNRIKIVHLAARGNCFITGIKLQSKYD
jgi:hypothetical protein